MRNKKNSIVGLRQAKVTYQEIFALLKKGNISKNSLSTVMKIGLKYEREGSIDRKSRSGRSKTFASKDDHRLKLS